jgi:SNF2 family DNA or RNA helicase
MSRPRKRSELRRYQRIFCNRIKKIPGLILALPMGAGKTATTLTAILDLLDDREVKKVLIVAPRLVAEATWPDEIEDWEHTSLLDWTLVRATDDDEDVIAARKEAYETARDLIGLTSKEAQRFAGKHATAYKSWKRAKLARTDSEVHIINKEALPWLWEFFGRGKRWPYDMLVIDEASMFKNGKMRTAKKGITRFGVAVKARKYAKRAVLLTGTPAPKGLQNLWGVAKVADGGERLGNSKHWFLQRWFTKDYMGWNWEPRPNAETEIMDRLSDIMFSLDEKDCGDLPPRNDIEVKVTLPRKVMEEYRRFEKTLVSELYDVEAVNRGVLHMKLLQFANGSMYREDGRDVWIHDEKLEALENIIDEANGAPVLVAYTFKFDLARIRKRYKKAVVFGEGDVRKTKERWNRGEIELLLAHPNSVGHGQNLQFGGNISVWYGLTPDLEIYQQFNKRLQRPGQTKPVFNHHIIAAGTYDEDMLPLLSSRDATQSRIIDSVRVRLSR